MEDDISVHFLTFLMNRFGRILYAQVLFFGKNGSDLLKKKYIDYQMTRNGAAKTWHSFKMFRSKLKLT